MEDELTDEAVVEEIRRFFLDHRPALKLPDGWFGRPFDNQHELTAISVGEDTLEVELDHRLRMVLRGPVRAGRSEGVLVLTDFTSLLWEREDYGSSGRRHRQEYGPGTVEFVVPAG